MTADADLVILIPLWQRMKHIERVYASARHATPEARIVFIVSEEDEDVEQFVQGRMRGQFDVYLTAGPGGEMGDYARKINEGYRRTTEPFIFTGADDLHFHRGWYETALAVAHAASALRPPGDHTGQIGVVGTVDLCNPRTMHGDLSTHSLVARWYADCCAVFDKPEAIYCEEYPHEYVDDELCETAKLRGAYVHSTGSIVEHMHMLVGKSPDDPTYERGRSWTHMGRRRFRQRKRRYEAALR